MTKIGLVGLPQSGKTTIFDALTGLHRETGFAAAAHPHVNIASIRIPDERFEKLCEILKPKKSVPAHIDIIDVPGISPDADSKKFEGGKSPAELLAALREADALIAVIRAFRNEGVPHLHGKADALRDIDEVRTLLLLTDLDVAERRIKKLKVSVTRPAKTLEQDKEELALLERLHPLLESGEGLDHAKLNPAEEKLLRAFAFLTRKPLIVLVNTDENQSPEDAAFSKLREEHPDALFLKGKLQQEISELDEADREQFLGEMGVDASAQEITIKRCVELLNLRTFFTTIHDEIRAWMVHAGDSAPDAAGKVHTDMQHGFIRAEVIHYDDFIACGSAKEAKARNLMKLEGKGYEVLDGDIIAFRFST